MNTKLFAILAFTLMVTMLFATASVYADEASAETDTTLTAESSASEVEVDSSTSAEINDNLEGSASGTKIGWENVKLWFTLNNEKKAAQELKIARLRLIQAKIAAQNGNTEAMQAALDAHDRLIDKIKTRINQIDGESTGKGIRASAEKLVGLERAIEVHEARISKLNEILANTNLTDEQRAKIEDRLSKLEDNTEHLRDVEAEKKDKLKTKLRAVGNMTEDEAEAAIEEIENAQNLKNVKKSVAEVKLARAENAIAKAKERIAKAEEAGKDVSAIKDRLANVEGKLQNIKAKVDARLNTKLSASA